MNTMNTRTQVLRPVTHATYASRRARMNPRSVQIEYTKDGVRYRSIQPFHHSTNCRVYLPDVPAGHIVSAVIV